MARILVGAKEAVIGLETGKAHSYLVFEDDAGARFVTSLTDVRSEVFPPSLRFDVEPSLRDRLLVGRPIVGAAKARVPALQAAEEPLQGSSIATAAFPVHEPP